MDMLLSSNLGAIKVKAVTAVAHGLELHGTPSALELANELQELDLGGTIPGDVRLALAARVFKWRTTLSSTA
jgi:predicted deacylase